MQVNVQGVIAGVPDEEAAFFIFVEHMFCSKQKPTICGSASQMYCDCIAGVSTGQGISYSSWKSSIPQAMTSDKMSKLYTSVYCTQR